MNGTCYTQFPSASVCNFCMIFVKISDLYNFPLFWPVFVPIPGGQICVSTFMFFHFLPPKLLVLWMVSFVNIKHTFMSLCRFNSITYHVESGTHWSTVNYHQKGPELQCIDAVLVINTLRPRQNGCHFPEDIFTCIFLSENVWILLKISLKFIPKVWNNNIPVLVQILAWRRPGNKPLSEPMMISLLMHICVTRPQ